MSANILTPGTTIIEFDSYFQVDTDETITLPEVTLESLILDETYYRHPHCGPEGDLKTVIVKVIDSDGRSVPLTNQQLSKYMWGPQQIDHINTINQFAACSHNMIGF